MSTLDYYDPLQLSSWHHFAYRAAGARVDQLRADLAGWAERGDQRPLEEFFRRHRGAHHDRLCSPRLTLSAAEIEEVLAGWQSAPDALGEYADQLARAVGAVRSALEAAGGSVARCLWDPVSVPGDRLAYLADLLRYGAPDELIASQRGLCVAELDNLAGGVLPPVDEVPDGFRWLLEGSIELCLLDPYQENVGLWRLYGVDFDPPGPLGRSLVDHPFAEGREPVAYGLEGSAVCVVGPDEAARCVERLRAFEPAADRLRAHAAERVRRALEEANEWDEEAWDALVDQVDQDPNDLDEGALAADLLEREHRDRLAAAVGELRQEWSETRDRMAAALDEVARGECVLLQWESKDPSV